MVFRYLSLFLLYINIKIGKNRFGSLVILDVACCYLWFYSLYINKKKIGKNSC